MALPNFPRFDSHYPHMWVDVEEEVILLARQHVVQANLAYQISFQLVQNGPLPFVDAS